MKRSLRLAAILAAAPSLLPSQDAPPRRSTPVPASELPLLQFGIFGSNAPEPPPAAPSQTRLPLELKPGDRIALVGNTLFDRAQDFGHFETLLQSEHPLHQLVIRHLAWSADEVTLQPRPDNFASLSQHLFHEKIDVILAAFGFNESFQGTEKIAAFKESLRVWVEKMRSSAFHGSSGPRLVLVGPPANENVPNIPAANLNNARIEAYSDAMAEIARETGVGFIDLFHPTRTLLAGAQKPATINGVHFTREGDALVSSVLFRGLLDKTPPPLSDALRRAVVDKNAQYFRRYRPLNSFYYTGGRNKEYGYLDFLPAMRNFDLLTANRDNRIWRMAREKEESLPPVDDTNLPPLEAVASGRGANEWLSAEDELKAFRVDPRFEVSLFASEKDFPDLARPIQMRWDGRGRLWVSCSTTYPHVYPGGEPRDKIIILEDTDQDGKADRSTVWAENLHIPLSFELTRGGAFVSEQPHLTLLRDTDGDGKADSREKLLTGFGTEDSHHSLHDFVWTPDGDLLARESIFHNSQVETPYGPVRCKNSGWFQFTPSTQRLQSFGSYPSTNPWGVTFDDWGFHMASHPIFASAFHSTNPPYPRQHPAAGKLPAYSGVCGQEFVDFGFWPAELQGSFIKVRYKPTNRVEIHRWVEKDDHYAEEYESDLIFSENLSFIPVDIGFGPRGDLYVCDWYNPIKGHAQYSLRDPRRDRTSGRIWRIVPKGATLPPAPVIEDAPIASLLELLKRPEYRIRYWAKRELRSRDVDAVSAELDSWVSKLDPRDPRLQHHQAEALWTFRGLGKTRPELLRSLLMCSEHHARAAAARMLRHWHSVLPGGGVEELARAASDANSLVRLESVVSASYIGTKAAFDAVMPIMHGPMGDHLRYAAKCAFDSEKLRAHWENQPGLRPMMEAFLKPEPAAGKVRVELKARTAEDTAFDGRKDLLKIEIATVPARMLFTPNEFRVKAGQAVKLVLTNPDLMQHNLLIIEPGSLEEVGTAANEMAKDPEGVRKGFVPRSDKVLHASRLLDPNTGEVLRFMAPTRPGIYPFVCTFPGHWVVMNGKMIVE